MRKLLLQMSLIFVLAFTLGAFVTYRFVLARQATPSMQTAITDAQGEGCKTDLLVVFPFHISQGQLASVVATLYDHYPEWSLQNHGAMTPRVMIHVPKASEIDEVKLESIAIGAEPALCLTADLRSDVEAVVTDVLSSTAMP